MMASCMDMPRQWHVDQLYYVFEFLKKKNNPEMVYDPTEPDVGDAQFAKEDWNNTVYGKNHEYLPPYEPQDRVSGLNTRTFVDADHSGDSVTRRSRTGFIIYLNSASIYWTSNNQTSIETSYFAL